MASAKLKISKNNVVGFHYTLTGDDGKVMDSSVGSNPLEYLHGHSQIVPGLENALQDKENGAKLNVKVQAKDGYGEYNPDLLITLPKDQFQKQKNFQIGTVFELDDGQGNAFLVSVKEIKDKEVIVDANHPLAGKNLNFDVEVVSIREATAEELKHGHVHNGGCC